MKLLSGGSDERASFDAVNETFEDLIRMYRLQTEGRSLDCKISQRYKLKRATKKIKMKREDQYLHLAISSEIFSTETETAVKKREQNVITHAAFIFYKAFNGSVVKLAQIESKRGEQVIRQSLSKRDSSDESYRQIMV